MSNGLLGIMQRLINDVRDVRNRLPAEPVWATVTQLSPLRVQPDGATAPLEVTPNNLAGNLMVGQRVLIAVQGRKVNVYGPNSLGTDGTQVVVGGDTREPNVFLRRLFGTRMFRARWYLAGNANWPEPALWLEEEGVGNYGVFRVRSSGQLSMETGALSPTTSAVRPIPFATAAGYINITPSAANTVTPVTITLPAGRFTRAPVITLGCATSVPHVVDVGYGSATASSFIIYFRRNDTSTTTVAWQAVQVDL